MNEDINLYEILRECPIGMPMYSSLLGDVKLAKVERSRITVSKYDGLYYYRVDGHFYSYGDSECTLFPSREQRDWSKFLVPIKRINKEDFKPFDKVLVRNFKTSVWMANFFSHLDAGEVWCIYGKFAFCIPYNEETKPLVGTDDECMEYYKWWEK